MTRFVTGAAQTGSEDADLVLACFPDDARNTLPSAERLAELNS